jgi:hypothetical protein
VIYSATLSDQEATPTGSTATGTVQLTVTGTSGLLDLSFSGLTSTQTLAHIHGPAPVGQSAGAIITLPNGQLNNYNVNLTSEQLGWLQQGLLYINIHTSNFPNGEIRGQLVAGQLSPTPTLTSSPTPTTMNLLGDIDSNCRVNLLDYVLLFENFGLQAPLPNPRADLDHNDRVNLLDYVLLFENFGQQCP